MRSGKLAAWGIAALVCACVPAPAAQAQDFFSRLFGGFARPRQQPSIQMPFGNDDGQVYAPRLSAPRPATTSPLLPATMSPLRSVGSSSILTGARPIWSLPLQVQPATISLR